MNRRHFTRLTALGAAGSLLPSRVGAWPSQALSADPGRLGERMRTLATFGANDAGGIDRVAFSDANVEALAWVEARFADAGFETSRDLAGNLIARRTGREGGLPPIAFGSHIDSVPGGGNFDGQVGSMGALEVATVLSESGHATRHPLEAVIFTNEEGGKTGSRALAGEVEAFELDIETASGFTIGEGLRRLGGDPGRLAEARRAPGSISAFLELHVEQGAVLDADGVDVGVVEGIVGIMRWNVTVEGSTNHAGTTPMDRRADALVGAARLIDATHRIARELPGRQVATVGRLLAEPGAPNVIPGRVVMSLEIRDLTMEGIERVFEAIRAEALGLSYLRMPSGAGHDAQSMALLGPVGMIFVPSVAGISHAPEEHTELADVVRGTDVLLRTLLAMDERGLG